MDIKRIRNFVTVAETLNFRVAAEKLHMAQPPLSVSIAKLEEELGVLLFSRTTKEVLLTKEGEQLLHSSKQLLFWSDRIKSDAKEIRDGLKGKLRIGFVGTATVKLLPQLINKFKISYPMIDLEFHESTTKQIFLDVENNNLDLGIIRTPFLQKTELDVLPLLKDFFVLAVPIGHPLLRKVKRIHLSEAKDFPFVSYNEQTVPGLNFAMYSACQEAGFIPVISQSAQQTQTVLSLVSSNLGIALIPSIMVKSNQRDDLAFIELVSEEVKSRIGLALVCRQSQESSVLLFRNLAKEMFVV